MSITQELVIEALEAASSPLSSVDIYKALSNSHELTEDRIKGKKTINSIVYSMMTRSKVKKTLKGSKPLWSLTSQISDSGARSLTGKKKVEQYVWYKLAYALTYMRNATAQELLEEIDTETYPMTLGDLGFCLRKMHSIDMIIREEGDEIRWSLFLS